MGLVRLPLSARLAASVHAQQAWKYTSAAACLLLGIHLDVCTTLKVQHVVWVTLSRCLPLLQNNPNCQARSQLVKDLQNDMRSQHGKIEIQQDMLRQHAMHRA
jgi:hypothetical protein